MAEEQGGRLPGGMGGLVQYYDEYEEPLSMHPKIVVSFILVLIGMEIALHAGILA